MSPQHSRRRSRIVLATTAAVACLVAATALSTLVLGDALPAAGRPHLVPARGLALAVTWTGLLLAIRWRAAQLRPVPLLLQIRLADEGTPHDGSTRERHLGLLTYARRRGSLVRQLDLSPGPAREPVDIATCCAQAAGAVEAIVTLDTENSDLTLACDMPWPAALAVGAQLPADVSLRLLELTGQPRRIGLAAREEVFSLPWEPATSLDALATERWSVADRASSGRVGLILAITAPPSALDPATVFAGFDISEYHVVQPAWATSDADGEPAHRLTGRELAELARRLPAVMASVKQRSGDRELVVAAAMPGTLALATGWGLAQHAKSFFEGTHLLHAGAGGRPFRSVRVHPAQRAHMPGRRGDPSAPVRDPDRRGEPRVRYRNSLKTLHLAARGSLCTAQTLARGEPFDVVGPAPADRDPAGHTGLEKLHVWIVNLSRLTTILAGEATGEPPDGERPRPANLRVCFEGGWDAHEGDVLRAIASYRLRTGLGDEYSAAISRPVVVVAPPGP